MIIIKPPSLLNNITSYNRKIFLAGSIEDGKAEKWQNKLSDNLKDLPDSILLLNPRSENWDSTWLEENTNNNFQEQINWELVAMETADIIAMHFDEKTMSPITLLELRLHARSNKLIVHCPQGFWKRKNVLVVCKRYGITLVPTINDLEQTIREQITRIPKVTRIY